MSVQLRATKHQLADLKRISELGTSRLSEVQRKLSKLEKPVLRPQELLKTVGELLEADAEPLVRQLLSLQGLVRQSGSSVDEVISGIRGAIEQHGDEIGIDTAAWASVEGIVKALVQDQSVRLAADEWFSTRSECCGDATAESFFDRARRLDQRGQTDAALDIIFDQIDEMLLAGEFDRVDQLLIEIMPGDFSVDLLLGLLTATLPAKNRLSNREAFFERVAQTLHDRGEAKDGLLVGLD